MSRREMIFGLVVTRKQSDLAPFDVSQRIRCPKCAWQPGKSDRWCCHPGCDHVWNTFDTRGRCPDCSKQWTETVCLRCGAWSRHDDWYDSGPNP